MLANQKEQRILKDEIWRNNDSIVTLKNKTTIPENKAGEKGRFMEGGSLPPSEAKRKHIRIRADTGILEQIPGP